MISKTSFVIAIVSLLALAPAAEAIVIIGGKTGIFTLTAGHAVRIHMADTGGELGIVIVGGKVVGAHGNTLAELPPRRLGPGQATSFEYMPRLVPGEWLAARVELTLDTGAPGSARGLSFAPSAEVFDTATGETRFVVNFLPPPDDSKNR